MTFPIIKQSIERVITVTEDEIKTAMRLIWERMKVVTEPSGAVPLAAVLTAKFQNISPAPQNVGIVLCGGNIDLDAWKW